MNEFKLIAIRPLEGCSKGVLKNLRQGQYYFFDNGYEPTENGEFIQKNINSKGDVPDGFFYKKTKGKSTSLESINIQAVVGKNGEGKSSLIELAIRVLNNFFKHFNVHEVTKSLIYVDNLKADLYFSISNHIFQISIDYTEGKRTATFKDAKRRDSFINRESIAKYLFFIININYSLYALNSNDFIKENLITDDLDKLDSWINKLFYKNDGYQTPLTIHPFRDSGNIEINREKELLLQRLVSLILTEESYTNITENLEVNSFEINFYNRDPLLKEIANIVNRKEQITVNDFYSDKLKNLSVFMRKYANSDFLFYDFLLNFIENIFENDRDKEMFEIDKDLEYAIGTNEEKIIKFFEDLESPKSLDIFKLAIICNGLQNQIGGTINSDDKLINALFQYLVVKANKILSYPKYENYRKKIRYNYTKCKETVDDFISSIIEDSSHTSFKFKQAYFLLKLSQKFPDSGLVQYYRSIVKDSSKGKFQTNIKKLISENITLLNKDPEFNKDTEKIYLNPPSIFKTDIILRSKINLEDNINLKTISSGEYQKIGLISSVIYHLKNLDSVQRDPNLDLNSYENILLILDEIELYFHPDYQRTFIKDFLFKLSEVKFNRIKSINILFITHSPFILSDIPRNNVLFLEKGSQVHPMTENTFGANIHTLLQHGFFLNSAPIGEFAKDTINELFKILHTEKDLNEFKDLEARILLVSEPFIKSQLLKLYHERIPQVTEIESVIRGLKNRISQLENQLKREE